MPASTLLDIDGIDLGDYSVRDLTMTLEPIGQAFSQRRTINGTLRDMSQSQFRKFRARISCKDHESPGLAEVPVGTIVTVTCLPHLGTRATDSAGDPDPLVLEMMVQPWSESRAEYPADTSWELQLEQV